MPDQPLADLQARLDRERLDADRAYNDALTALDRAVQAAAQAGSSGAAVAPSYEYDPTRLAALNDQWQILPDGMPAEGGDRSVKGRLRALVWRLVRPPLEAQTRFNAAVVDHLNRNAAAGEALPRALDAVRAALDEQSAARVCVESVLVQYLQTLTAYIDTKDRRLLGDELRARLALVEQRVLALKRTGEAPVAPVPATASPAIGGVFAAPVDSLTYVGFEDAFRGSEEEIGARVADYVPIFAGLTDVVDVGCGRGELLEALAARGIGARGVDVNAGMVALCRSKGLEASQGDAVAYLAGQADGGIGGLVAVQVVEHFAPAYLTRFLETAYHKMRPGAPLVLETLNPACWLAFFECYIRDITHERPLHPDTLRYLVQASGFQHVDVQYRRPVPESDRLARVSLAGDTGAALPRHIAQLADAVNAHADTLNGRLFSSTDYVVVARR